MTRLPLAILLLATLALPGCFTHHDVQFVGGRTFQLAQLTEENTSSTYVLEVSGGRASLKLSKEWPEDYLDVGVRLEDLNEQHAKRCGVRPYSGLLVKGVDQATPAAESLVRIGDIVLEVNGTEVFYVSHFNKIADKLKEGQELELKVTRPHSDAEPRIVKVPAVKRTRQAKSFELIPLDSMTKQAPRAYCGVVIHQIPKEHSKKIYGDDRNAVFISGVGLGSPAYLAGLRAGDMLESIDGRVVPDIKIIYQELGERGMRGETVKFEVSRDNGRLFEASVELEDYEGSWEAKVPFVFGAENSARSTEWWMILGGWLAAYENAYENSDTRETKTRGSFSMILGLFKYSWAPTGGRTRLLWFIRFG